MGFKGDMQKMIALDKAKDLALKEYKVSTVTELKAVIVEAEFQKIIDKYLNEAKKRIIRKKQDEAKNYKPTDKEITERLQSKLDVPEQSGEY